MIFNIVFFVSITSVIIQGTSLPLVAKFMKLTLPEELKKRTLTDLALTDGIKSLLTELVISDNSLVAGKQIVQLGLPKTTLISFILRDDSYIIPNGSTILEVNDTLFILSENKDALNSVFECLDINKPGSVGMI